MTHAMLAVFPKMASCRGCVNATHDAKLDFRTKSTQSSKHLSPRSHGAHPRSTARASPDKHLDEENSDVESLEQEEGRQ